MLLQIVDKYKSLGPIEFETRVIQKVNWNEEWEKNFEPINVGDKVYVRATFHESKPEFTYEIVIEPKMSFGTGHHDTTYQMLMAQLNIDHKNKVVLDAGTGTGILAIMAHKLGAKQILANDIDEWCVSNSHENYTLNNCGIIKTQLGTVSVFHAQVVDILLANINKNVLLSEMSAYSNLVKSGGKLVLSGFYKHDIPDLEESLKTNSFKIIHQSTRNNWACLTCAKL